MTKMVQERLIKTKNALDIGLGRGSTSLSIGAISFIVMMHSIFEEKLLTFGVNL